MELDDLQFLCEHDKAFAAKVLAKQEAQKKGLSFEETAKLIQNRVDGRKLDSPFEKYHNKSPEFMDAYNAGLESLRERIGIGHDKALGPDEELRCRFGVSEDYDIESEELITSYKHFVTELESIMKKCYELDECKSPDAMQTLLPGGCNHIRGQVVPNSKHVFLNDYDGCVSTPYDTVKTMEQAKVTSSPATRLVGPYTKKFLAESQDSSLIYLIEEAHRILDS